MAGLVKAKKYDWKDSNMALFGSDTERQVKKESAETEPAWEGAGTEVGLQIWRIVKFQVTHWPKEDYGQFFNGDSYIILNTYTVADSEDLKYDLHFWIGKTSSQDEYGTAAYKTVELDTFLDDKAVQHREVQNHESDLFKSYFKQIQILEGGAETGFRHVEPVEYIPRLLRFSGKGRNIVVSEIPKCNWCLSSLKSEDVFIFDKGLEIIQWNGGQSNGMEKVKAAQFCQQLESEREKAKAEVEDELCGAFKVARELPESPEEEDVEEENLSNTGEKVLLKVSDEDGSLDMDEIKRGDIAMSDLGSDDVYLVDVGYQIFVFVGQNASPNEKRNGMPYAHSYVKEKGIVPFIPLCVVKEGNHGMLESALA